MGTLFCHVVHSPKFHWNEYIFLILSNLFRNFWNGKLLIYFLSIHTRMLSLIVTITFLLLYLKPIFSCQFSYLITFKEFNIPNIIILRCFSSRKNAYLYFMTSKLKVETWQCSLKLLYSPVLRNIGSLACYWWILIDSRCPMSNNVGWVQSTSSGLNE